MSLLDNIKKTIKKYSMLSEGDKVLVGLSGGPDSVCLLYILNQLKEEYKLIPYALYIDHGLRLKEIPQEIGFCKNLCNNLEIAFISRSINVQAYASEHSINKQEAARELRYKTFEEVAFEIGANKIALAHNADDQAETFFMRILRGSGQKGLSGIPPVRGKIIRPLIETERKEIEEYLDKLSQTSIIDSSNLKTNYFRNWLRLSVIPDLKKKNPELIKTISRVIEIIREEDNYLELIVTKTLMKLISKKTDKTIELFLVPLETMDKVILRRVLRRAIDAVKSLRGISFVHIEDILELIKSRQSGDRIYLPKGIRVIKGYSTLIITSELPVKLGVNNLHLPGELILKEAGLMLKADFKEMVDNADGKFMAAFDADKIKSPLIVRARQNGDFFYPYGFGKRKKLQDFFVDEKIPKDERDAIPIVLSGDDIIWIVGYRTDDRFKITETTKRILILESKAIK